jgi:hypothetical protein
MHYMVTNIAPWTGTARRNKIKILNTLPGQVEDTCPFSFREQDNWINFLLQASALDQPIVPVNGFHARDL